jgi:hypothetical protein
MPSRCLSIARVRVLVKQAVVAAHKDQTIQVMDVEADWTSDLLLLPVRRAVRLLG